MPGALMDFEIQWLDWRGEKFATELVTKDDLTAAIRYAGRLLVNPGSNPKSEGPGRRKPASEAHGVFVRVYR